MRPLRRLLAATIVFGLSGALVGTSGPAAASASDIVVRGGVTQPVFSYQDAIRETVYVQSTLDQDVDGDLDLIATDIIRPKETAKGLKVPVIYEMSPYYGTLGRGEESEKKEPEDGDFVPERFPLFYDNYFVPRGYAFIAQDMRGTRNSEGCMSLGGPEEVEVAKATIDWLNGRGKAFTWDGKEVKATWTTGRVGMIGKSYDGSVANGAAALGIRGLETIVPIGSISRWYDYMYSNGVQFTNAYLTPGAFSFPILFRFLSEGGDDMDNDAALDLGNDQERGLEWAEATYGEHGPCSAVGAHITARSANPVADYDDYWQARDYLVGAKNVKASVFLVHGMNDYNVKPQNYVPWWHALAKQDVPRKIWLAQVGHVDPFDFRRSMWVDTLHRWFDHWLQKIDNGIMREPMADVQVGPERWETYRSWPVPGATATSLWFGPEGKGVPGTLSSRPHPKDATQSYTDNPLQSQSTMIANHKQASSQRLIFLSPELKRDVRISGRIFAEVTASVDRPDTNFTALLVDYGEGHMVERVLYGQNDGISPPQPTETCHGESTKADDACYKTVNQLVAETEVEVVTKGWLDARHHESLESTSPLVPGQVYKFRWEVMGDDYEFLAGHRIGVVIAGSDSSTVPDPFRAGVTVQLAKSRIILPVVGGSRVLGF